jgi:hypothetical protein
MDRFRDILAEQRAQDQADLYYHPLARRVGQGAGLLAGLVAPEALGAKTFMSTVAPGLKVSAERAAESGIGHVARTAGVTGGVSGLVGQGVSDAISGRASSPMNYAAAGGAGVLGGWAGMVGGAPTAGAVTGAATPFLQAVVSGRTPSFDDIISGGASGAVLGRLPNEVTARWIDRKSSIAKGRLGDDLSVLDAWLRLRWGAKNGGREKLETSAYKRAGGGRRERGYTIPDVTADPWWGGPRQYVEAKFGPRARLERAQPLAAAEYPKSTYTAQSWQPRDVGNMAGVGLVGIDPLRVRGVPVGSPFVLDSDPQKRQARLR